MRAVRVCNCSSNGLANQINSKDGSRVKLVIKPALKSDLVYIRKISMFLISKEIRILPKTFPLAGAGVRLFTKIVFNIVFRASDIVSCYFWIVAQWNPLASFHFVILKYYTKHIFLLKFSEKYPFNRWHSSFPSPNVQIFLFLFVDIVYWNSTLSS